MEPGEQVEFEKLIGEYATPLRPTINEIHEKLLRVFAEFNEIRAAQGLPPFRVPSRSTAYRAIKRLDPYQTYLQRYGRDAANKKFALVEYGVSALRPMERVEIDEWEIDLIALVSGAGLVRLPSKGESATFEKARLIVCVAIDCATRCVVGLTLSRSASSAAAIRALNTATTDKTDIASSLGCRAGWHQGGRPEIIAADMGAAFVNDDFKMTCAGLHARLINPPGGVAKLRSRIERVFGTFASHFVSRFRGRTHSNPVSRGDYDAQAEASLTDRDLLEAFVTYVVDVYHQRPHDGLLGESPAQCWDRLTAKYGQLPVDAMDRRAIFGTELERSISGRGVRVFGADYACDELREAYKHSHQRKVRLRLDQMDLGWIAVEINRTWYPAHDLSGALSGTSFAQWSAFARTVSAHNRERQEMTAGIYRDGLKRLEALSKEAARTAQLGRLVLNAAEVDQAEQALGMGLYLLPAEGDVGKPGATGWFENGIAVNAEEIVEKDLPTPSDIPFPDPVQHKGWRFESDD